MKANQLELRVDPADGRIMAVHVQRGKPARKIKDITDEVMLCLCADLSANDTHKVIAREIKFTDGMAVTLYAEMTQAPDYELRAKLDKEFAEGRGNGREMVS